MTEGLIDETVDELVRVKESEEESRKYLEAATATTENVEKDRDSS